MSISAEGPEERPPEPEPAWVNWRLLLVDLFSLHLLTVVSPTPATHAIWTVLKAGETAYLIYGVYKTLLDTIQVAARARRAPLNLSPIEPPITV